MPHRGVALAFRRTYNSQSEHDVYGTDGSQPGMYGNGWTNTFDAHIVKAPNGTISVYDIDGTRYDYVPASTGGYTPPPGQHASLGFDGGCGFLWTKKSGTVYHFYRTIMSGAGCGSSDSAYAGRLYRIVGRNANTMVTLTYSWENGVASAGGKISQIVASTESGLAATLTFADFNGFRLLMSLTRPDGVQTTYGYGSYLNLRTATLPPNNAAGTAVVKSYGYGSWPGGNPAGVMNWTASPRWSGSNGTDGAYLQIGSTFNGSDNAHSSLSEIDHIGFVDPTPADGTNTPIQPAPANGAGNATVPFLSEYFALGGAGAAATPTFRDTDGHYTNWVTDASSRPTQTQECTTTQNQQCTGTMLITGAQWSTGNDMTSTTDARGYETDYAYDANGNTVEVGYPTTTAQTASGTVTMRPTKLFDYDASNNVIAYCDERETHMANADWQGPLTADNLCSSHAGQAGHWQFDYAYPAYEPFGEQGGSTTPLGYHRTIFYPTAPGADYGLPTSVVGATIVQADRTTNAENTTFAYDANGDLTAYGTGSGTWQLKYDVLGRLLVATDPDGVASYNHYWPDGSLSKTETATQHASSLGVLFARDLDGNVKQETHHYTCTTMQACTAGTTQKWYDGADRLVEVMAPQDPSDRYPFPWLTRYVYDLTSGGSVAIFGQSARAYGTLYKTQEWLANTTPVWAEPNWSSVNSTPPPPLGVPSWTDVSGSGVDALGRTTAEYRQAMTKSNSYDMPSNVPGSSSNALGLLAQTCNGTGECRSFEYDERGNVAQQLFSAASSPAQQLTYDEDGRKVGASSANGTVTIGYDNDGREVSRNQAVASNGRNAVMAYHYYADGRRASIDVTTQSVSAPAALSYSYRADGSVSTLAYNYALPATWAFTYTNAGRLAIRTDTINSTPTTISYDSSSGLPNTITFPAGANSSLQYDAEGELTAGVLAGAPYTNYYTVRGEALTSTRDSSGHPTSYGLANGVMVPITQSVNGAYWKPYTYSIDAIRGTPVDIHAINTCAQDNTSCGTDSNGDVSSDTGFGYDRAARQSGSTVTGPQSVSTGNIPEGTVSKHYDVEDHLVRQDFANMPGFGAKLPQSWSLGYSYGPEGHPYLVGTTSHASTGTPTDFQYDTLFWDDDAMLFSEDAQGNIDDFKIGTLADFEAHAVLAPGQTGPLLSVIDRDAKGQTIGCHASNGTTASASGYGSSFNANGPACTLSTGTIGRGGILTMPRTDGLFDGWNAIQGVRTYDTQAGVWNTPDAYRGDVHDPMSQKPYVWNGNNPYQYSDPSGFDRATAERLSAKVEGAIQVAAGSYDMNANLNGFLNAVKSELTSIGVKWTDDKGNGNFSVKGDGVNIGVYGSDKDGNGGRGRSVQMKVSGADITPNDFSRRYTMTTETGLMGLEFPKLFSAERKDNSPRIEIPTRMSTRMREAVIRGLIGG